MKSLLKSMLLVAAVLVGQNAWAEETTIFSMNGISGPTGKINKNATADVTASTLTGGSAKLYNGNSTKTSMVSGSSIDLSANANSYCLITLTETLQADDVITFYDGDEKLSEALKLSSTNSNSNYVTTSAGQYTVASQDIIDGTTTLYIWKDSATKFSSVTIVRTDTKTASDLALASSSGEVERGNTINIQYTTHSTGIVEATSSNPTVATVAVNSNMTVTITGVVAGTATITVSQAADDTYAAGSAKYTVTVNLPVTIGAEGMATLYSDQKLKVPDNVTAYTYIYDSNTETLVRGTEITAGKILPANQGYVIKGSAGVYIFTTVSSGTAEKVESDLTGSTSDQTAKGDEFGLNKVNGKFDFYLLEADIEIPAGKAYFQQSSGN